MERSKDRNLLVGLVNILDRQDGERSVIAEVAQRDTGSRLDAGLVNGRLRDIESDGHGEEDARGEAIVLDDSGFLSWLVWLGAILGLEDGSRARLVVRTEVRKVVGSCPCISGRKLTGGKLTGEIDGGN